MTALARQHGCQSGGFAQHGDVDLNGHVGVQVHAHRVVTHQFQRAMGHAHLGLVDGKATVSLPTVSLIYLLNNFSLVLPFE